MPLKAPNIKTAANEPQHKDKAKCQDLCMIHAPCKCTLDRSKIIEHRS